MVFRFRIALRNTRSSVQSYGTEWWIEPAQGRWSLLVVGGAYLTRTHLRLWMSSLRPSRPLTPSPPKRPRVGTRPTPQNLSRRQQLLQSIDMEGRRYSYNKIPSY